MTPCKSSNEIFASAMIHRLVSESFFSQTFVGVQFVGVNGRALRHIFLNQRLERFARDVRNYFCHHLPIALQHSKHNRFVRRTATANTVSAPADVSLINFNVTKQWELSINVFHMLANKISQNHRSA